MDEDEILTALKWLIGVVTGLFVWAVASFEYGLFGFLFGWLPAILFGCIAAALTPLIVAIIVLAMGITWMILWWKLLTWLASVVYGATPH